jgi:hypothetical protein
MNGAGSRMPQSPDSSKPSVRKRWAFTAVVVVEVLFVGYLIAQSLRADDEWRPWYLLGAGGLSLMVGAVMWSRGRRHAPRS